MANNPLLDGKPKKGGKVTVEMLEEMAADLNRQRFVIDRGWHYFVSLNEAGKAQLDRREHRAFASIAK